MNNKDIQGYYGRHEEAHTYQSQILGPLYIPANIISLTSGFIMDNNTHGAHAFLEVGPSDVQNTRPWWW